MRYTQLHSNIKLRLIEQLFARIAANSVLPFMIIYFAKNWGGTFAGIAMMLQAFIIIISNFYGGYIADRLGRRYIMLTAEYIRFFAYIFMALAISHLVNAPIIVFIMLILVGISSGIAKPAGQAMLIDVSDEDNRKLIFSFDYWSNNISLLIGMILGGYFFKNYKLELILGVACASLLSLIFLQFFIKETLEKRKQVNQKVNITTKNNFFRDIVSNYKNTLQNKVFTLFIIASLLDMSVETQANNFLAVRLVEDIKSQPLFEISNYTFWLDGYKLFSLLYIINTLTVLILGIVIGRIAKLFKDQTILIGGILIYTLGYAFLAFSDNIWALLIVMVIVTLGEMLYVITKQSLLADIAPIDNRSSYMAVNNLSYRIASFIAPLAVVIKAYVSNLGISIMFILFGTLAIIIYAKLLKLRKE